VGVGEKKSEENIKKKTLSISTRKKEKGAVRLVKTSFMQNYTHKMSITSSCYACLYARLRLI